MTFLNSHFDIYLTYLLTFYLTDLPTFHLTFYLQYLLTLCLEEMATRVPWLCCACGCVLVIVGVIVGL